MKKKLLNILKTTILFLLLFTFTNLVINLFNINITKLTDIQKYQISFYTDLVFLLILFLSYRQTIINDFKNFFKNFFTNLEIAFKYYLIGFIIMIISNFIIIFIAQKGIAQNEEAIRTLIDIAPLYMIFSTVIYAPFTEELIFRKGFKDIFNNKRLFILASGITFGALHVISYITTPFDYIYLIPYCALGISFAFMYNKTNNIFSSISMHLMHNSMAIILYLIGSVL